MANINPKFDNITNYRYGFEHKLVDIPKKASLFSRIQDRIMNWLCLNSNAVKEEFESPLALRSIRLVNLVDDLKEPGDLDEEGMKLYNVRSAEFLQDFRSKISDISAKDPSERFFAASRALYDSLKFVNQNKMHNTDKFDFYAPVLHALYDEFFDFVAECYKYEVVKTGTIANIDHVYRNIFAMMHLYDIPTFRDVDDVKERFRDHMVKQLPSMIDLCKHKTELILKTDPEVEASVKSLNKQIFAIETRLDAFKNIKTSKEKTKLEDEVLALYDKRAVALDSIHYTDQLNAYRLHLVRLGTPIDEDNKADLAELAKESGYDSLDAMLEFDYGIANTYYRSIQDTKSLVDFMIPYAEQLNAELKTSGKIEKFDSRIEKLTRQAVQIDPELFEDLSEDGQIDLIKSFLFDYVDFTPKDIEHPNLRIAEQQVIDELKLKQSPPIEHQLEELDRLWQQIEEQTQDTPIFHPTHIRSKSKSE